MTIRKLGPSFALPLCLALAGVIFGIVEVASAGENAKGCRTRIYTYPNPPEGGPYWILNCIKVSCPDASCVPASLGGGYHICNCPSNSGSIPADFYSAGSSNCVTYAYAPAPGNVCSPYCLQGVCPDPCTIGGGSYEECICP